MSPVETSPRFLALRERFVAGELVIFAGAGVSMAAGLPSWKALILRVLDEALAEGVLDSVRSALERARAKAEAGRLIDAMSVLSRELPGATFVRLVQAALDEHDLPVPDVVRAIAELDLGERGLRAVVTTNLDRFHERAFAGRWADYHHANFNLGQDRAYILKLHGTRHLPLTWVLTREQYEAHIHGKPQLFEFLRSLYLQRTFLFVGYGMSDPDLELLLGWIRVFAGDQPPRHFALMAEGSLDPDDLHELARAGVDVIFYPAPGGSHAEVPRLLRALRGAQRSSPPPSPPTPPPPREPEMNKNERLAALFREMFGSHELRRLINNVEHRLADELREDLSLRELSLAAANLLIARGLVAEALDRVAQERPRRIREVDEARAHLVP